MNEEYHQPFIKSLIFVAIVTIFAMVSGKYVTEYYLSSKISPLKTLEYSSQKSHDHSDSTDIK
jgi:hypothetical protein